VSSDYEGCATLWDAQAGAAVSEWEAHEKRIWSVDFCAADPALFCSGSDDGWVKARAAGPGRAARWAAGARVGWPLSRPAACASSWLPCQRDGQVACSGDPDGALSACLSRVTWFGFEPGVSAA